MIVHLNLHQSERKPIKIYNDTLLKGNSYSVKVSHNNLSVILKVCAKDYKVVKSQHENGIHFDSRHYVTYEIDVDDISNLTLHVELFVQDKCIGHAYLTPGQFAGCSGHIITALIDLDSNRLCGDIEFDYLIIKPWKNQPLSNVSRQHPHNGEFVYIGHRGCGKTIKQTVQSDILENTLSAFHLAHQRGASFVETDIQLTKDLVPVIYHDFNTVIHMGNELDVEIPVRNLSVKQLKGLEVYLDRPGSAHGSSCKELFPTLEEALHNLPDNLGLLLELKYPYQDGETGEWEVENFLSRNDVVDAVLDVVMNYHGNRPVLFTGFDPGLLLMLQYKQSRFGVVMASCGENESWQYMDMRNNCRGMTANFALMYNLSGISIMSDPLVNKLDELNHIAKLLAEHNCLVFTWGVANSDVKYVQQQIENGVSGVITDHLEKLNIKK